MPSTALRDFLAAYPPAVRTLVSLAREEILRIHPDAVEKVWPGWKVVGYGIGRSMAEMVVGVAPLKGRIGLYFTRGTDLPDPDGLLRGAGKKGRNVPVEDASRLASRPVRALLRSAFRLARESRASRAEGVTERGALRKPAPAATGAGAPTSDAAVRAKTGRSWGEWVAALDAAGARGKSHREIVAILAERFDVGPWWRQMVTVGYERATGARGVNQTSRGYQVGGSRTVAVPVDRLWRAWTDPRTRARWLPGAAFTVRKATEPKSLRITWGDGSDLQVNFYAKGDAKSVVQVDQRKLPDAGTVERMRAYWRERLDEMRTVVEG